MGNALFVSMWSFSTYAGNKQIVLAILGKGLNVRSHIYIYIYTCMYTLKDNKNETLVCLQIFFRHTYTYMYTLKDYNKGNAGTFADPC